MFWGLYKYLLIFNYLGGLGRLLATTVLTTRWSYFVVVAAVVVVASLAKVFLGAAYLALYDVVVAG